MSSCLGIYIENNLIKYAKVSKDHNDLKIESFGVKVYENLGEALSNIVEETYSYNIPVSINLANEQYVYFDIFALLNQKDIKKSVETEFENYCDENKFNFNAFETRYALVQNVKDKDQLKTIDIAANKIELNRQIQNLSGYKLTNVMPLPMTITNLASFGKNENAIIVNMEETVTITVIINSQIYQVDVLETGSKEVLENINKIENSYSKAYDICKNTTIYTADVGDNDDQPHLQYMIPVLYNVNQKLQEIIGEYTERFKTVYLTGTLANINNVDLYFQEFLPNTTCKILKPAFLEDVSTQINMKDYVEVNSAISLALAGIGEGIQGLNFKKVSILDQISKQLNIEVKSNKKDGETKTKKDGKQKKQIIGLDKNFKAKLDSTEIWIARGIGALLLVTIIFISFSAILGRQMDLKEKEITDLTAKQNAHIKKIETNTQSLNSKIAKYESLISDLELINERISDIASSKNTVPNLLNQIMYIIPEAVQLTSIENTSGKTIVINAESSKYEQLGYFIAKIKEKGYLTNVVSSSGAKSGGIVSVEIKGDLP